MRLFAFRADAAARQRLDAGEQLRESVGLGQIIVAAGAQSLHAVVDLAERREDQRRRLDALLAQARDQRQPVHLRQHAIDEQHVIVAVARARIAGEAVRRMLRDMALLAKSLDEIVARLAIVFDNENAHGFL